MSGIEVSHINHALRRSCRESREIDSTWSRVNITESQLPITNGNLKKLERHDAIGRAAQEPVRYGGVNVAHKAISDVMNVRDVARERWSISRNMTAYKSFLNEYDVRVVATYVRFQRSKLWVGLNSTGIPRDDVKLHSMNEVYLWVSGRPVGTMTSRQRCREACVVVAP